MAEDTITLEADFKRIEAALKNLPTSLENKGARKATREVAKVVQRDAKALVPVDEGELERSIKVRARKRSRRNKGTVGHSVITAENFGGDDQYYASFVELGTQYIEADPFIRPALWSNQQEKLSIYRRVLLKWLNTDAPKAAAKQGIDIGDTLTDLFEAIDE